MERKELRSLIPQGYCKVIALRANVTRKSVSCFMSGKTNSRRIEMAALEVLAELKREKDDLINQLK